MRSKLVHDGDTFWVEFIELGAFVGWKMICANPRSWRRIGSGGRKAARQVGMRSGLAHILSYITLVFYFLLWQIAVTTLTYLKAEGKPEHSRS